MFVRNQRRHFRLPRKIPFHKEGIQGALERLLNTGARYTGINSRRSLTKAEKEAFCGVNSARISDSPKYIIVTTYVS